MGATLQRVGGQHPQDYLPWSNQPCRRFASAFISPSLGEMMGNRLAQISLVRLERSSRSKGVFAALCQLAKVPPSERGPWLWEGSWLFLTSGLGRLPGANRQVCPQHICSSEILQNFNLLEIAQENNPRRLGRPERLHFLLSGPRFSNWGGWCGLPTREMDKICMGLNWAGGAC